MTPTTAPKPPPLPVGMRARLTEYRSRIWTTKTAEVLGAALLGLLVSYLVVFAADRVFETPGWLRLTLLAGGVLGFAVFVPLQLTRWVGRHASLEAVARRIAAEDLTTGDSILGVMDLVNDAEEFGRSPELALAAIEQGDARLKDQDLSHTLPASRHRAFGVAAAAAVVVTAAGFQMEPEAARNAFARWARPTADIPRYTFTRLAPHAEHNVVARFEGVELQFDLDEATRRRPSTAKLTLGDGTTRTALLGSEGYTFQLDGRGAETDARLAVGDYRASLTLEPVDRPEVLEASARVDLPAYLELPEPQTKDVRAGSLGVVAGSAVALSAELTRELRSAQWSAGDVRVDGARIETSAAVLADSTDTQLAWEDIHGLAGAVPFQLGVRVRPDAQPTVVTSGLTPNTILLHDQAAVFQVSASDDFGVRQIGLEWEGFGELEGESVRASGEKLLGLGEPGAAQLELAATLHPKLLGIDPQFLRVRAFAVDALPGRERCYSAPVELQVMTEDEHMIWVTRALASWFDEAVEVRDEEHALLQVNEELFELSNAELSQASVQRQLADQAAAERSNRRRLNRVNGKGGQLLAEAARNEQFNSNTMEEWANMLSILEGIADSRMASVADLLAEAAKASPTSPNASAGVNRSTVASTPGGAAEKSELPDDPSASDVESSFNDPSAPGAPGAASKPPPSSLSLVDTVVEGGGPQGDPADAPAPPAPAAEEPGPTKAELAKAIAEQRALMEEFELVAGKIAEILENLEGSTFVKRLKALSRAETGVAQDLDATLVAAFGSDVVPAGATATVAQVAKVQERSGQRAATVREDLAAYLERMTSVGKDPAAFRTVHTEMGEVGVTREMSAIDDLAGAARAGEAIASAENLADDLDRWAEIIVGPG